MQICWSYGSKKRLKRPGHELKFQLCQKCKYKEIADKYVAFCIALGLKGGLADLHFKRTRQQCIQFKMWPETIKEPAIMRNEVKPKVFL